MSQENPEGSQVESSIAGQVLRRWKAALGKIVGRRGCLVLYGGIIAVLVLLDVSESWWPDSKEREVVLQQTGELSKRGGTRTVRRSFARPLDDPRTSNDESNDQPVGYFGTMTLEVFSYESGHYYTLDGELDGFDLERLYFPKGGWIDFYSCELDEDFEGQCTDEKGRGWSIEGEF